MSNSASRLLIKARGSFTREQAQFATGLTAAQFEKAELWPITCTFAQLIAMCDAYSLELNVLVEALRDDIEVITGNRSMAVASLQAEASAEDFL